MGSFVAIRPITGHNSTITGDPIRIIILIILLLVSRVSEVEAVCNQAVPLQTCNYNVSWKWDQGEGPPTDGFILEMNGQDYITSIAPDLRTITVPLQDSGYQQYDWRLFAFNSEGRSAPSNTATVRSLPVMSLVTLATNAIVTTSRRANDTSSVISILVNANTVIGAGGLVISHPPGTTLLTSRRATSTSSVIAILVNKSTIVSINPP